MFTVPNCLLNVPHKEIKRIVNWTGPRWQFFGDPRFNTLQERNIYKNIRYMQWLASGRPRFHEPRVKTLGVKTLLKMIRKHERNEIRGAMGAGI